MFDLDDNSDRTLPRLGALAQQLSQQAILPTGSACDASAQPEPPYPGSCHCGAVKFRVNAPITEPAHCDCPHCQSRSIVLAAVDQHDFELLCDEQALALHPFHRRLAQHCYCPTCGVYPFLRPRDAGDKVFVNVFCLDEFDPSGLTTR